MDDSEHRATTTNGVGGDAPRDCEFCSPEPEPLPDPRERAGECGFEPADEAADSALPLTAAITETWT